MIANKIPEKSQGSDPPKPIYGMEIFKLGDYSSIGRYNWTEKEYDEINETFFTRKAKDRNFKGVDIAVSLNPNDPHDMSQAVRVGKIHNIFLDKNGIVKGDGHYYRESGELMRNLAGKSAGLKKIDGKWSLDHVAVAARDRVIIPDLKPNITSMFSKRGAEGEVYLDTEINDKEKSMTTEINFSKAELELEVKNALEKQKADLEANFAKVEQKKDGIIAQKDETITELNSTIAALKEQNANFAKAQTEAKIKKYHERIDAIKGIRVEEKEKLKERVANFAERAFDGYETDIEDIIAAREEIKPLVEEGEHPGERKTAEFADYKPMRFGIDEIHEEIEKNKGGE